MQISIIVAASNNNVIGVQNQLPWHLPADLQYFKSLTIEHTIIMGRKTYQSIGRALPKRENIVITRDPHFTAEKIIVVNSIEAAIEYCNDQQKEEVFIIGGDTIYQQTMSIANQIYLTRVHTTITNGTAFFPKIDLSVWQLINSEVHTKDEKNEFDYTFETYEKMMKN